MKHAIIILILTLISSSVIAGETNYSFRIKNETVSFHNDAGNKITLSVGMLYYKDRGGDTVPTPDTYVVEVIDDDGAPIIVDFQYGSIMSFQLADMDENKGDEVLAFYIAGAHQYGVKIYKIDGIWIKPLRTQPISSNMHSVKLKGKDIVVENEERIDEHSAYIYTDTYRVIGGECKLVKESKTIARDD